MHFSVDLYLIAAGLRLLRGWHLSLLLSPWFGLHMDRRCLYVYVGSRCAMIGQHGMGGRNGCCLVTRGEGIRSDWSELNA